MEIYGLDVVAIILTAAFVVFWGAVLIGFALLYNINPYIPRRYYHVPIFDKEGKPVRNAKGWIITKDKVKWLRIGIKGFPSFKGVEKDIAIMETMNKDGEIEVIENVPDKYEAENYTPKNIPITQKEAFIGEAISSINEEGRAMFELKLRELLNKYSRLVDLNTSKATKEYISQARREAERVRSDDFIYKYGPIISLIVAGLFSYMILDGAIKAYQVTVSQQNAVMQNGYSQIISQCGGVYTPLPQPQQNTTQKNNAIPFLPT